jgi:hypothetical protein
MALLGATFDISEWQFLYNGLLLGDGTSYDITGIEGLGIPDSKTDIVSRAEAHGAFVFARYLEERHIILEGRALSSDGTLETLIEDFRVAFLPQKDDLYFELMLPGWTGSRVAFCKPTRRPIFVDFDYGLGIGKFVVELVAQDPRLYSVPLHKTATAPKDDTKGIDFDVDFDVNFGGGSGGTITVLNEGIIDSPPILLIRGPCVNPRVVNARSNETMKFNITLAATDWLIADAYARTVILNDVTSRYDVWDDSSIWWSVYPGPNGIAFSADSFSAGALMLISWRDEWV